MFVNGALTKCAAGSIVRYEVSFVREKGSLRRYCHFRINLKRLVFRRPLIISN